MRNAIINTVVQSAAMTTRKWQKALAEETTRTAKLAAMVDSLEHRLSRQATHLQNLTGRIKDLETSK